MRPDAKTNAVVVNLAPYFVSDRLQRGPIELAWSQARAGRHWYQLVEKRRWLVVEGNPNRLPLVGESLSTWLAGRWGSFRGIEVLWDDDDDTARLPLITAFVDPWASRPLYYSSYGDTLIIADKVATIAANQANPGVDWAALAEAMLCGSVYSGAVSLKNTTAIRAGEEVHFLGPKYQNSNRHSIPLDSEISEDRVHTDPVGALLSALAKTAADTWGDPRDHLLLTGGLDSRFILALGGPGRSAIHIKTNPKETRYAREVAAAADNCQLIEFDFSDELFLQGIKRAFLLTGAMFDSRFAWQLGLGAVWHNRGIVGTLNGYLFDTLLKGYFLVPYQKYPYSDSPLSSLLGPLGHSMRNHSGRFSGYAPDMIFDLLKPEAQELGKQQLLRLPEMFPQRIVGDMDLSFEDLVLSEISRQVHYPLMLGLFEETEASIPAFHVALWSWHAASSIEDRRGGRALRQALACLQHPVCRIPDSNTEMPIDCLPKRSLAEKLRLRNYYILSSLRDSFRRVRPLDAESKNTSVGPYVRTPEARSLIREWIDRTHDHPIFDPRGLDHAWNRFEQGDDRAAESLLVMMGVRQWEEWVKHPIVSPQP